MNTLTDKTLAIDIIDQNEELTVPKHQLRQSLIQLGRLLVLGRPRQCRLLYRKRLKDCQMEPTDLDALVNVALYLGNVGVSQFDTSNKCTKVEQCSDQDLKFASHFCVQSHSDTANNADTAVCSSAHRLLRLSSLRCTILYTYTELVSSVIARLARGKATDATSCLKKTSKIISVITMSNFHQI